MASSVGFLSFNVCKERGYHGRRIRLSYYYSSTSCFDLLFCRLVLVGTFGKKFAEYDCSVS